MIWHLCTLHICIQGLPTMPFLTVKKMFSDKARSSVMQMSHAVLPPTMHTSQWFGVCKQATSTSFALEMHFWWPCVAQWLILRLSFPFHWFPLRVFVCLFHLGYVTSVCELQLLTCNLWVAQIQAELPFTRKCMLQRSVSFKAEVSGHEFNLMWGQFASTCWLGK